MAPYQLAGFWLDEEQFQTTLTFIEHLINSRPLTPEPIDSTMDRPLTPLDFMTCNKEQKCLLLPEDLVRNRLVSFEDKYKDIQLQQSIRALEQGALDPEAGESPDEQHLLKLAERWANEANANGGGVS